MAKYKYILFDLDGTLDDPFEGITKSVQYAMKKFGVETEQENLKCFIGPPLIEMFSKKFNVEVGGMIAVYVGDKLILEEYVK